MKLTEGEFSHVPAQPHTGLLGILIKHREQLEPGNRITGNAAVQTMALSRAIIEALGGTQVDGRWEVEIGDGSQDVKALIKAISKLDESQERLEDKFDEKNRALRHAIEVLNARLEKVEQVLAQANQAPEFIPATLDTIDIRETPAIVELRTMVQNLERAVAAQSPRKRSPAKADDKQLEPQGE